MRLTVLTTGCTMKVYKYANASLTGPVDCADYTTPGVLVYVGDGLERCTLTIKRPETPVTNGQANSVNTDRGEILKVGLVDESVPVTFENSLGIGLAAPSRSDVDLCSLWARSTSEQGRRHPLFVHEPTQGAVEYMTAEVSGKKEDD